MSSRNGNRQRTFVTSSGSISQAINCSLGPPAQISFPSRTVNMGGPWISDAVAVFPCPVDADDKTLVFDRPGLQEGFPVVFAAVRPVGQYKYRLNVPGDVSEYLREPEVITDENTRRDPFDMKRSPWYFRWKNTYLHLPMKTGASLRMWL